MKKVRKRARPEIDGGSMADIGFLLLIFFLVCTTIDVEHGRKMILPPWDPHQRPPTQIASQNLLKIQLNKENDLFVKGHEVEVSEIQSLVRDFVLNPNSRDNLPNRPSKAVVSFQHDRGAIYHKYFEVLNEICMTYDEMRSDYALKRFGTKDVETLPDSIQNVIKKAIPIIITEPDPTEF